MRQIRNQSSGFTLVEVLIALFVFSIGILGVGAMQLRAMQGNSHARQVSEMTNVAADQIETIAGLAYDDASLLDGAGANNGATGLNDLPPNNTDGSRMTSDGRYQVFWNVAEDYPLTDSKTVRVIVRQTGQTKSVSLETIKLID